MQDPRIAIIGGGTLATHIAEMIAVKTIPRQQFDFCKHDIVHVSRDLVNFDVIIVTAAINQGSTKDIFCVNMLQPIQLLTTLIDLDYSGRVILVGSHGATWPSWPGIDLTRMNYNFSKRFLREFAKGLAHSGQCKMKLTIFEPTKFRSKMSGFSGADPRLVAESLVDIIKSDRDILHVELN